MILWCSDLATKRTREALYQALADAAPGCRVVRVERLCSAPPRMAAALSGATPDRLVVVCCSGAVASDELYAAARKAGVSSSGVALTHLDKVDGARVSSSAPLAGVRVGAAMARLLAVDLAEDVDYRTAPSTQRFTRRSLFHPTDVQRHAIAHWSPDRCVDDGCRACVESCPYGALGHVGDRVVVSRELCVGCGVCVAQCATGCLTLPGASIRSIERELDALIRGSNSLADRPGISVCCSHLEEGVSLAGPWMPLVVPSLEMTSVGWLLQVVARGASVQLLGCANGACSSRGHELVDLGSQLMSAAARQWCRETGVRVTHDAVASRIELVNASAPVLGPWSNLSLVEPEATLAALRGLRDAEVFGALVRSHEVGATATSAAEVIGWVESDLLPLGILAVDESRCSSCGCCSRACPTGSLASASAGVPGTALLWDPSICTACGVCVTACPEDAITLRHRFDGTQLRDHRRTLVARRVERRCASCGGELFDGLEASVLIGRLAGSHPRVAERLRAQDRCADCLLTST